MKTTCFFQIYYYHLFYYYHYYYDYYYYYFYYNHYYDNAELVQPRGKTILILAQSDREPPNRRCKSSYFILKMTSTYMDKKYYLPPPLANVTSKDKYQSKYQPFFSIIIINKYFSLEAYIKCKLRDIWKPSSCRFCRISFSNIFDLVSWSCGSSFIKERRWPIFGIL